MLKNICLQRRRPLAWPRGLFTAVVQHVTTEPLILEAEKYEGGAARTTTRRHAGARSRRRGGCAAPAMSAAERASVAAMRRRGGMGAGRRHRAHALHRRSPRPLIGVGFALIAARRDGARRASDRRAHAALPSGCAGFVAVCAPAVARACRRNFPAAARPSSARGRPGGSSRSPRPRSALAGLLPRRQHLAADRRRRADRAAACRSARRSRTSSCRTAPAELAGAFRRRLAGGDGDLLGGARLCRRARFYQRFSAQPDEAGGSCSCSAARARARAPTPRGWSRRAGSRRSMSRPPTAGDAEMAERIAAASRAPRRRRGGRSRRRSISRMRSRARRARAGRCSSTASRSGSPT